MSSVQPLLSQEQRAILLNIARQAIRNRVRGIEAAGVLPDDPLLRAPGAAFVTITRKGQLRGCIGYVEPIRPLAKAVAQCAASAAVTDPRFPPVTPTELPHLHIEVSVLSRLRKIADPNEIQVGTHGIFISHLGRHGLLLPQVATEFGWDRDTFLEHSCLKAGLPSDAWKHGAEIQVFTVDHFTDGLPVE